MFRRLFAESTPRSLRTVKAGREPFLSPWDWFERPVSGITVSDLDEILEETLHGVIYRLQDLYEDMLESDSRLAALCQTRILGITGRRWVLDGDDGRVQEALSAIDMEAVIGWLADGMLRGIAVCELVWPSRADANGLLVPSVEPVSPRRLAFAPRTFEPALAAEDGTAGELLEEPDKWLVLVPPPAGSGSIPPRRGALRGCLRPFLVKHYATRWWLVASERFGQPAPVVKLGQDSPKGARDVVLEALRNLSSDWSMILPPGTELEIVPGTGAFNGELHERLIELANRDMAVRVLGQTLTTDIGKVGSRAAAEVHDQVRQDILAADARLLERILNRQLIEPIVRRNWPSLEPPKLRFVLQEPEIPPIEEWHLTNGVVSVSEVRERLGFQQEG